MHIVDIESEIVGVDLDGVEAARIERLRLRIRLYLLNVAVPILQDRGVRRVPCPAFQLAEHGVVDSDPLRRLTLKDRIRRLMRRGHLRPLRIGASLACTVELLELFNIDQLNRRRILIVLNRRLIGVVALADAQETCLAVTADDDRTARTEVDRAGSVHDHVHLGRTCHEEIRRWQTQTDAVLTPLIRQFLVEIPMPQAHIRQDALRIGLDIGADMVRIQERFLERLDGKIEGNRARIDRRLNNALDVKGRAEDRLLEPPCHHILGKTLMVKDELILLDADVGTDLRILRHQTAQTLLLLVRDILGVELIRNPFQEALCAARLHPKGEHILLIDNGGCLIFERSNIAADLLSKTKRTLVKELPKCVLFQM